MLISVLELSDSDFFLWKYNSIQQFCDMLNFWWILEFESHYIAVLYFAQIKIFKGVYATFLKARSQWC